MKRGSLAAFLLIPALLGLALAVLWLSFPRLPARAASATWQEEIPPAANFTPRFGGVPVSQTITFTNLSTGFPQPSYTWDFGDGSAQVTDTNPAHAFAHEGLFTVTLVAENPLGKSVFTGTVRTYVPVRAAFSIPDGPTGVGRPITFTNHTTGTGPYFYTWDFGGLLPPSHETNPIRTYDVAGVYWVTLTVTGTYATDEETGTILGNTDQVTRAISVSELMFFPSILRCQGTYPPEAVCAAPPTAAFSPTYARVARGSSLTFTNLSRADPLTAYYWDFGDGTRPQPGLHVTHTFNSTGTFTVTLTADSFFGVNRAVGSVWVYAPAQAAFAPAYTVIEPGETVIFTNLSTGIGPLTYTWDFGDGSPVSQAENPGGHTYFAPRTYFVTLTVVGPYESDTFTGTVAIRRRLFMPLVMFKTRQ